MTRKEREGIGMSVTTIDISVARERISEMGRIASENSPPVVYVQRHRKPAFAVVDVDYLETLIETVQILEDPEARAMLAASLEDIRKGRLVDHESLKRELL